MSQTVTITNGTDTQTATGLVTNFTVYFGTWTITGGGVTKTQVVDTAKIYDVTMQIILGIKRSTTATSPAWERTDEAVGKTVSASIGSTAGHSDFDSVYPYSQITRETIGSDVLVKIPKFYYRRYQEDGYEYIKIADVAGSGFVLHPAFDRADGERDYFYVGAYKTSSNNNSVSNASPQISQTRATMRTNAKAKGSNWGLIDIAALNAIQMLIMIEFATNDVQTAIGAGYTNASAALITGSCDAVPNLTGRPSGTSNVVDVVWRGIEGFWGNIWEWVDGLNFNNGIYYVCTNPSNYADDTATNYEALNYTGSTSWSSSYISQIGMDNSKAWAMMPSAASGSSSTYYCDGVWSSTNWRVFKHGGKWTNGPLAGLFASAVANASSYANTNTGSRLLYLPLS